MALISLLVLLIITAFYSADSQSFIGVNYGQVADNLPPPSSTTMLLRSTTISSVRLYGADPVVISALAGTGIRIVVGASNSDIPALASDPNAAAQWIASNVAPFADSGGGGVSLVSVGNEVLTFGDDALKSQLLPAMRNLQTAISAGGMGGKVRVSTVHAMSVLGSSDPPSSGRVRPELEGTMAGVLGFLRDYKSPFAINPYPFFAYQSDPRPETLAFCLFQPNSGRVDSWTGIKYMNMFDAQVDAVHSALSALGFKDVDIMVAETGWPYSGDIGEVGPSVDNAKAYNGNLLAHLRSLVGTPLMPGRSVETYLFALYDENLKPGPASERAFGLFRPDLTMTYDVGLSKSASQSPSSTSPVTPRPALGKWCMPKAGVGDRELQSNLDYACSQSIDCRAIQPGGACFEPATLVSHAAYAMNLYYQTFGKNPWNCEFGQTAILTYTNPSYNGCIYPGGST